MPTYEYGCDACGNQWELEQRISADPVKKCPKCGKLKARRMISGGNFILKGGGWYADLYSSAGSSSSKKGGTSESKSEAKSGSSTSTSETKTAKKAANE